MESETYRVSGSELRNKESKNPQRAKPSIQLKTSPLNSVCIKEIYSQKEGTVEKLKK